LLFTSSVLDFSAGASQAPKIEKAHCRLLSWQWALNSARSDAVYMGGPPLPRYQRMDMLHMITGRLSASPKDVVPICIFICSMVVKQLP